MRGRMDVYMLDGLDLVLASMGREDAEASFLHAFRTSIRSPTALTVFLMGVSAS